MKKFLTAKNILTAIPLMLSLGMLVAAEIIRQLPGKNELIYYKGVSSEFYANASVGAAACFGALFLLVLRMRTAKRAAALLMTLLCTIAVTGSALLMISILADKHRYYMYNNMYNYGSHRILHAKDGEDFVLYQQSGRYTFQ
ncbi:MAG: hypothetical protein IJ723_05500, partial [Ruminococcus sp.]|nr:hypothetical protein [Ruminococcus sp.]